MTVPGNTYEKRTGLYRFKTDHMASELWLVRSVTPPGSAR